MESHQKQKQLEMAYTKLSNENKQKTTQLKKDNESEISDLKHKINDQEKLIAKLQEQIKGKNESIANLEKEKQKKEHELDTFFSKFDTNEDKIKSLQDENQRLSDKVIALEDSFSTKQKNQSAMMLEILCKEKELLPNEIEDFLKALFFKAVEKEIRKF